MQDINLNGKALKLITEEELNGLPPIPADDLLEPEARAQLADLGPEEEPLILDKEQLDFLEAQGLLYDPKFDKEKLLEALKSEANQELSRERKIMWLAKQLFFDTLEKDEQVKQARLLGMRDERKYIQDLVKGVRNRNTKSLSEDNAASVRHTNIALEEILDFIAARRNNDLTKNGPGPETKPEATEIG